MGIYSGLVPDMQAIIQTNGDQFFGCIYVSQDKEKMSKTNIRKSWKDYCLNTNAVLLTVTELEWNVTDINSLRPTGAYLFQQTRTPLVQIMNGLSSVWQQAII